MRAEYISGHSRVNDAFQRGIERNLNYYPRLSVFAGIISEEKEC